MNKLKSHRFSIEQEVITAIVVLYLSIAAIMIVVHYIQPANQLTVTSSSSPSHAAQKREMP